MEKYYVDEHVGCIAVREKVDYRISPGLHVDLSDVVAYWHGRIGPDGKFEVQQYAKDKAKKLCDLLNKKKLTNPPNQEGEKNGEDN